MKKLAIGFLAAVLTLSTGIALTVYFKHRAQAKRCAESTYFPAGVFGDNPRKAEWHGKFYAAQAEPKFSCIDEDIEAYRLLYLASFESATSIRVWREDDKYWITIKQLEEDWLPPQDIKPLKVNTTWQLDVKEWAQFKELLNRANFWSMQSPDVREQGLDGVGYILEGKQPGRYHVVYRWMPEDQSFTEACNYLVKLSNLTWRQR